MQYLKMQTANKAVLGWFPRVAFWFWPFYDDFPARQNDFDRFGEISPRGIWILEVRSWKLQMFDARFAVPTTNH